MKSVASGVAGSESIPVPVATSGKYAPEDIAVLAQWVEQTFGREEALAALRESLGPPWPDEYVNRDTGRVYEPHNEKEGSVVLNDAPRHALIKGGEGSGKSVAGIIKCLERVRKGMSGAMVCVAADTLVDGIPIAGRTDPAPVNTLLGPAWASPSCREGRADLFRVVTESGDQVVVTASHRFLTPVGWRPLRDLRVGALIAVDGSDHGQNWREISPGSLGDYWLDSRPCGGLPNPGERRVRDKRLLPGGERVSNLSPAPAHQAHAYTDHSSRLPLRAVDGEVCWPASEADRNEFARSDAFRGASRWAYCLDNPSGWPHDPTPHSVDNDAKMQNGHVDGSLYSPVRLNTLPGWQWPLSLVPDRTELESRHSHIYVGVPNPYTYYNTGYTRVSSITFQKHGDFYGLTVPSTGHYSAHGLFHHNSPDLPHYKKSLWLEFRRWCPWDQVDPKHQYRQSEVWEPYAPFRLVFRNGASLECGGIDEPGAWEGPNINFAFMDEMRRKKTPAALKVMTGRIRIPGPNGEPPQLWITTTPRRHWLYDFFGPLKVQCSDCGSTEPIAIQEGEEFKCKECGSTNLIVTDEREAFKRDSVVITLLTKDNEPNLEKDFAAKRALSLTEAEARVLLEAAWEDIEGGQPYLPHMTWWDDCREDLPVLDRETPLLLAVDAATGRTTSESDSFAIVGITRHPDPKRGKNTVAVRYIKAWQAKPGQKINFLGTRLNPGPEWELLRLCGWDIGSDGEYVRKGDGYNVKCIVTDPTELNDLMQRFNRKRIAWMYEFSQREKRIKADTDLLRIIQEHRLAHDGDATLRQHVKNADRGLTEDGKRLRIVKREDALKIDLLVATSMGTNRCLYLQL